MLLTLARASAVASLISKTDVLDPQKRDLALYNAALTRFSHFRSVESLRHFCDLLESIEDFNADACHYYYRTRLLIHEAELNGGKYHGYSIEDLAADRDMYADRFERCGIYLSDPVNSAILLRLSLVRALTNQFMKGGVC